MMKSRKNVAKSSREMSTDGLQQEAQRKLNVDHPAHYQSSSGLEAIDVIDSFGLGFSLGNAVKYICRAGKKDDRLQDLEKARWYISHEIKRLKADSIAELSQPC